jgi:hypothetical protein
MNTFATKVKKFLKRGKAAQINKFHDEVVDRYNDEIDRLSRENKKLDEKIERQKEAKTDYVFNIDLDRLKDVDSRERYVEQYARELIEFDEENIDPLVEERESNKEQIKLLQSLIKFMDEAEPNVEDEEEE